jgi:hypothetical protein
VPSANSYHIDEVRKSVEGKPDSGASEEDASVTPSLEAAAVASLSNLNIKLSAYQFFVCHFTTLSVSKLVCSTDWYDGC